MLDKFESLLVTVLSSVKMSVQDYCDIETVDEDQQVTVGLLVADPGCGRGIVDNRLDRDGRGCLR